MHTMIALVGGQPLPNLIPVRHCRPQYVVFVYTSKTKEVYQKLESVLRSSTNVRGFETEAYNVTTITEQMQRGLREYDVSLRNAVFNLTGATKAMSLAAYQIAQRNQSPVMYLESEHKQSIIYRYHWNDEQLLFHQKETLPACISLKDWLDVQLGVNQWQEYGVGTSEGAALEQAVGEALRTHGYDVMFSVKSMQGQLDLDVVYSKDNQFGIIEVKSGNAGSKLDGLKQLSTAGQHLGTFVQKKLVITKSQNESHRVITEISKVNVISLTEYHLPDPLTAADQTLLINALEGK